MLLSLVVPVAAEAEDAPWREFYVSAQGSDTNDGQSAETPFKTLVKARDAVREISADMQGRHCGEHTGRRRPHLPGRHISPLCGRFRSQRPPDYLPRCAGPGPKSCHGFGGDAHYGFVPSTQYPGLWETKVTDDDLTQIRQLYVNNKKSYMAQTELEITGIDFFKKANSRYSSTVCTYPNPSWATTKTRMMWNFGGR